MSAEELEIVLHLLVATAAGGLIGLERSFHGRPAGFRTHTLVCVASSMLMLVTIYSGRTQNLIEPILNRFAEETGISVEVRYGDTSDLALLIAALVPNAARIVESACSTPPTSGR